jgi:hypothetical protein
MVQLQGSPWWSVLAPPGDPADSVEVLRRLRRAVDDGDDLIPIHAYLKLTKTERNLCSATLLRDKGLEEVVMADIAGRAGSFERVMARYQEYDPSLVDLSTPKHVAVHVLSGLGSISSGKNIFLFFPQCLGLVPAHEQDCFGFELIDVWTNVFEHAVYPCLARVADLRTKYEVFTSLRLKTERTIFLASIFHEIGHRVGPYRVSPRPDPRMALSEFHVDVLGELATDSLLVVMLEEFPEIAQFVMTQRLFWFPRRGFMDSPEMALINQDNDSWIGAYLWNTFEDQEIVRWHERRLSIDWSRVVDGFRGVLAEIDALGAQVLDAAPGEQDALVQHWMDARVERSPSGRYVLPAGLRGMFEVFPTSVPCSAMAGNEERPIPSIEGAHHEDHHHPGDLGHRRGAHGRGRPRHGAPPALPL